MTVKLGDGGGDEGLRRLGKRSADEDALDGEGPGAAAARDGGTKRDAETPRDGGGGPPAPAGGPPAPSPPPACPQDQHHFLRSSVRPQSKRPRKDASCAGGGGPGPRGKGTATPAPRAPGPCGASLRAPGAPRLRAAGPESPRSASLEGAREVGGGRGLEPGGHACRACGPTRGGRGWGRPSPGGSPRAPRPPPQVLQTRKCEGRRDVAAWACREGCRVPGDGVPAQEGAKRLGACARSRVCGLGLLFRGDRTVAASLGSPQSNKAAGELCPDGHSLLFPACICSQFSVRFSLTVKGIALDRPPCLRPRLQLFTGST